MIPRPFVLGLAGGSGSGKSFLAAHLLDGLADRGVLVPHDAYYRPLPPGAQADAWNFDAPDAVDSRLLAAHLHSLRAGQPVDVPHYAFHRHDRVGSVPVAPRPVVIVEGILVLAAPELDSLLDLRVFVDTPEVLRFERRLTRDVEDRGRTPDEVRERFARWVQPMHDLHVAPSRGRADLVLDGTAPATDNVALVVARLPARVR